MPKLSFVYFVPCFKMRRRIRRKRWLINLSALRGNASMRGQIGLTKLAPGWRGRGGLGPADTRYSTYPDTQDTHIQDTHTRHIHTRHTHKTHTYKTHTQDTHIQDTYTRHTYKTHTQDTHTRHIHVFKY
jgi:hypothetical protein